MNRPGFRAHSITCVRPVDRHVAWHGRDPRTRVGYASELVHKAMVVVPVDPGSGGFLEVAEPVERSGAKW
jgi:hypothetical protein